MFESIFVTFLLVFLAELGDKTQLATMLLATQKKSAIGVFIGASTALVLSALIGVTLGHYLSKLVPEHILKIGAGISFIVIGVFLLWAPKG
ncbi:TMEM165/GDT1 family protein [Natranaerobius trueperi]|uniref:GDT1 family protein n=1 Tax=Natranaerobius trueperi TaxID=759412 RepID=A0A226BY07_9FIRM|nr:TMEM165/GDT1 family protein [Natranaerobius trueperi]OWZ83652.1 hypothetical protein CDO51_07475 [Natranaerobius trueperi]